MAAGTSTPVSSNPRPAGHDSLDGKLVEFDQYIESQIHRTRRQVKGVDLSTSSMMLAVGTLVYLMLVALADHWLVSGGLGFAGRLTAFLMLAAGVASYVAWRVAPLLLRRINPVYAAHTIERNRPGIKNSLINFLLLRSSPAGLAPRVYEAMEAQAVNALTAVHSDVPVDRKPVIRLLLALMGIVFCLALYSIISPKSPFASFRRVVAPWSDVASPTRVKISDVQPGDATGFHDQHVAVSAEVLGVRSGESVTLYYSTLDGQVLRRPASMSLPENSYRFTGELPPDSLGLQQNLEYWIEAGDAASPHYQIKVETPPSIVVDELVYEYPKYSELPQQRVAKQGDIQALEGTRVSLAAAANQNIRRADLDFECDGRNDLTMKSDGRRASVAFTLGLDSKTHRSEHETYQLRFTNGDGHENPKPIRYTIDVIRDLPPEIELVEPQLDPTAETPLKAGSSLRLTVRAADPDFKLADVKLHARRSGLRLLEEKLLADPRAGEFTRDFMLDSRKLALKPGDAIELWVSADDNKQPEANHVETPHYTLRIASPDARPQPDQLAKNDRQRQPNDRDQQPRDDQQKQPAERNADDKRQQDQQPGEQGEGEKGGAQGEQKQNKQQQQGGQNEEDQEGGEGEPSGKKDDARGAKGDNKQSGGENSRDANEGEGQGKQGENAERQGEGGQPSDEQQRVDPNRDPGKAFEKILEHLNKDQQQGEKNQDQQPQENAGQQQNREQGNDADPSAKNAGQKQRSQQEQRPEGKENQTGERQPGEERSAQEQNGKDQSAAGEKQEDESGNQGAPSGGKQQSAGKPNQAGDEERPKDEGKTVERNLAQKKGDKNGDARDGHSPDDQADGQPDEKQTAKPKPKAGKEQTNAGPGDEQGDQAEGEQAQGDMPPPGGKTGKQSSDGDQQQAEKSGERSNAGEQRKPQVGDGKQPKREAEDGDESAKPADGEQEPQKGEGDQASGFGEKDEKSPREHGPDREHKGGDPDSKNKGDGGAGQEGESNRGAASPMNPMQAKEKKQTSDPEKTRPLEDEDPAAASESKKSSDSKGEQSGDQAGGGNASGGQRSNSSGVGSAGQNTASEEGGGQSPEKGKGPTGTRGGDQTKGDEPAEGGKASDEKGAGSHQREGGDQQGGADQAPPEGADLRGHSNDEPTQPRDQANADRQQTGKPAGKNEQSGEPRRGQPKPDSPDRPGGQPRPSDQQGNDVRPGKPSSGRANPTGGGGPPPGSEETPPNAEGDNSEPGGDDPKLEYTRKATDLALEKLQDQVANDKLDPELLEKLKWTPEDMQRFLKQWQQLKHAAEESGPRSDAARELDEALRSLGLRPRGAALEGGRPTNKNVSGLREGQRTAPPPEYREQYREFSKAKAQGLKKSK